MLAAGGTSQEAYKMHVNMSAWANRHGLGSSCPSPEESDPLQAHRHRTPQSRQEGPQPNRGVEFG